MRVMNDDAQTLPDDINELKALVLSLKSDNRSLQSDNQLQAEKITSLRHEYDILVEQIKLERMRKFGNKSEGNILQPSLFDECDAPLEVGTKEELDDAITVPAHTRKRSRKPLPKNLPRNIMLHDIDDEDKQCDCGCMKECFGEEVTEQLEYVPAELSVTAHVRPKYSCPKCKSGVAIAPMPILLLPKSIAAPSLVAHIIIAKYQDHLPLHRQEQIFKRIGVELPKNTTCGWVMKVASLCEPLWYLLQKQIIAYDYAQADETTFRVLKEAEKKNNNKNYLWVYRGGPPDRRAIVYDYQQSRAGIHARTFLQGFKGYLQTDCYSGYEWADDDDNITRLACMAHTRRPFAELVKIAKKTGKAHQVTAFIGKLYAIEKYARKHNLTATERYQLRLNESTSILEKLKTWADKSINHTPPQSKLGKSIAYLIKHWSKLTAYLKDGRLEIDNNATENNIRPFAVGRHNWLFAGNPRGAEASATSVFVKQVVA